MQMVTQAFMQKGCPTRSTNKALHTPWCHLFWFMTGKSSRVHSRTQSLFPLVADDVLNNGYCKYCIHPAGDED